MEDVLVDISFSDCVVIEKEDGSTFLHMRMNTSDINKFKSLAKKLYSDNDDIPAKFRDENGEMLHHFLGCRRTVSKIRKSKK